MFGFYGIQASGRPFEPQLTPPVEAVYPRFHHSRVIPFIPAYLGQVAIIKYLIEVMGCLLLFDAFSPPVIPVKGFDFIWLFTC